MQFVFKILASNCYLVSDKFNVPSLVQVKKDVHESFSRELFFHYFYLESFKSAHRENKFREGLNKDPVAKISSTEFIVFGPGKPKHFVLRKFLPLRQQDFAVQMNSFAVIYKTCCQLSRITQGNLQMFLNLIIRQTNKIS